MKDAFTIRRHYASKVDYWISEEVQTSPVNLAVQNSISVGHNTSDPLDWRVAVTVTFSAKANEKDVAKGTVVMIGFFNLPESLPEKDRETFAARSGTSILYAAARELIANLSARAPHIILTLPPASFGHIEIKGDAKRVEISTAAPARKK